MSECTTCSGKSPMTCSNAAHGPKDPLDCGECEPSDDCHACLKLAYQDLLHNFNQDAHNYKASLMQLQKELEGYRTGMVCAGWCR